MKKLVGALVASLGLAVAGPSAAVVVGGIDFGPQGNNPHLETETLAETVVTGVGDKLQGYGYVTTVNGAPAYCSPSPCSLYYYFHDYTVTKFDPVKGGVEFSGGVVDIYYAAASPVNLLNFSSPANVAFITGLTLWASLTGHTFLDPTFNTTFGAAGDTYTLNGNGTLTGGSLSENGEGLIDVDLTKGVAGVAAFLNTNSESDNLGGFADITLTSSSNTSKPNIHDVCTITTTGPVSGQWCLQGTLNTRGGGAAPEPGTLALLGLGLACLGFVARRKSA